MVHAGKSIHDYLKENGISVVKFSGIINRSRAATYKILSNNSINTDMLYTISKGLVHNFFSEFSDDCDNIV